MITITETLIERDMENTKKHQTARSHNDNDYIKLSQDGLGHCLVNRFLPDLVRYRWGTKIVRKLVTGYCTHKPHIP